MAPGEEGTGEYGRREGLAEAFEVPCLIERYHGLYETVDRPTRVTLALVDRAEVPVRECLLDDIPASRGECEGTLGGGDGLVIRARKVEIEWQKARDPSQPPRVVE